MISSTLPFQLGVLLLSVTVHEACHAWLARLKGDPTAEEKGRLTLNPIPHLDIFGSIIVPLLLVISRSPFLIGWAKPVPVNPFNFKHPRQDMMWVSLGGPASNLGLATVAALLFRFLPSGGIESRVRALGEVFSGRGEALSAIEIVLVTLALMVVINVFLAVFNLFPIHPLDGSGILSGLLPPDLARKYDSIAPYGFLILILLLMTGILGRVVFLVGWVLIRILLGF